MALKELKMPIVRANDRAYFNMMSDLVCELGQKPHKVHIVPMLGRKSNQGHWEELPFEVTDPFGQAGGEQQLLAAFLELEGMDLHKQEYHFHNWGVVKVTRDYDVNQGKFNSGSDRVEIHFSTGDRIEGAKAVGLVRKHFKCSDTLPLSDLLGADVQRYYDLREANVQKLEDKMGELTAKLADFAIKNEQELQKKKEALEEVHRQRIAELEEERKKLLAEIAEREKLLDDRAAKINDRENVHERRRLYDEIKKQIQSKSTNPKLTDHTQNLRRMVWGLCGALAVFLLTVFIICFRINLSSDTVNWVTIGTQIASAATLIGVATFVIRWQNRWFESHSDEEFRLKRMELDIERASWLVELALEWFAETKNPIPQELLDKLSTSLFTEGAGVSMDMSPLEALRTGLLGKNWKVSLEPKKIEAESREAQK